MISVTTSRQGTGCAPSAASAASVAVDWTADDERGMSAIRASVLALFLACVASAQPVHAQDGGDARARALRLFDESETAFGEGRYDAAAALLREAYALQPEPVLLYNLARSYEELGELSHAIETYEAYAAAETDEAARRAALARRDVLTARLPPPPEVAPSELPRGPDMTLPVATLVTGSVLTVVAVALAIAAEVENGRATDLATPLPPALEAQRTRDALAVARDVVGSVGGALLIGGGVWVLALPAASSSGVSASLRIGGAF
jgi:tetratricopeptide (TPR) repeat protein